MSTLNNKPFVQDTQANAATLHNQKVTAFAFRNA